MDSAFSHTAAFPEVIILLEWTPAIEAQFHVKLLMTFTVIRLLGPKTKEKCSLPVRHAAFSKCSKTSEQHI